MRVLVVEDEIRMAALIRQGLEEEAYAVDIVSDGPQALDCLRVVDYDLVILDLMLPGMDGLQVCREYRDSGGRIPILMLTARNTLPDRVIGLDSGADDCLGKPFGMPELLARLRALTRREGPSKTAELCVQDLILDTTTKCAVRAGKRIELTATEYALLELLMRHEGQILSRDQIIFSPHCQESEAKSSQRAHAQDQHIAPEQVSGTVEYRLFQSMEAIRQRIVDRQVLQPRRLKGEYANSPGK